VGDAHHEVQCAAYANPYVERLIGSIRRECLDHVIILSLAGLQRVLADDVDYYMNTRTHLSLGKDAPASRPATPPSAEGIVEIPPVNGLHHRYDRAAAQRSDLPTVPKAASFLWHCGS
jgi:putative transposase